MADYVDFKAIKEVVSIESVAARYGIVLRQVNASHKRGKCPFRTHPVGDDKPSFSVNVGKQVWICHSAGCAKNRRGRKGGDVIELVAAMENCSLRDAGLKLAGWFSIDTRAVAGQREKAAVPPPGEGNNYGVYSSLVEWIEDRTSNTSLSRFEHSAYLAVLGKIEDLVTIEGGAE